MERISGINRLLRRLSILHGRRSMRPLSPFERHQRKRLLRAIVPYLDKDVTQAERDKRDHMKREIHRLQHKMWPSEYHVDGTRILGPRPMYPM